MLGRIVLTALQVGLGWGFGPSLLAALPIRHTQLDMFLLAIVFAVMFWAIGLVASMLLKDVSRPSLGTLSAAIVMGLAGAAMTWIPPLTSAVDGFMKTKVPSGFYPLFGALIGYMARR